MNPFDYLLIAIIPALLIFFLYPFYKNKENEELERIREWDEFDEKFEKVFEEWSAEPTKENEEKLDELLRRYHG